LNSEHATSSTRAADAPGHGFLTTHWSAVLMAGRQDTPRARNALAELCQTYWYQDGL